MGRVDPIVLRLELLRTRAMIERAELCAAVIDLRAATAPLRKVVGFVSGRPAEGGARGEGVVPLLRTVIGLLRARPWLVSALATAASRRGLRRWLLLGATVAIVAVAVRRMTAAS